MAHVNLLPWREKQRQHQKKQYLMTLVAVAAFIGLIFWFIGQAIDQTIKHQQSRNAYLNREIAVLDAQIAQIQKIKESKNAIEQRMSLIEQLQASRNVAAIIFDELANIVPSGVTFSSMKRSGNQVQVEGMSDSNNHLSDFIRALDASSVFSGAELSSIKADTDSSIAISNYTLTFIINPSVAPLTAADEEEVNP